MAYRLAFKQFDTAILGVHCQTRSKYQEPGMHIFAISLKNMGDEVAFFASI